MSAGGSRTTFVPPLLRVSELSASYPTRRGRLPAVQDVSFQIAPGECFGLVGESGCGKSTLARIILRLLNADRGRIDFDGLDLLALRGAALRRIRPAIQMVFQDPLASLNPRLRIETIIGEAPVLHGLIRSGTPLRNRVAEWLERVGLRAADAGRYPHEFSGGQRQRIAIARALILQPKLLICDEAVSALDVSISAQILKLLAELRRELGLTCLFISHNLAIVRHFCHQVAVMYLGRIVEQAEAGRLFERPLHPYTQALIAACPDPGAARRHRPALTVGEPPDPVHPPSGCSFHPRCPLAVERCRTERPNLRELRPGQVAACHRAEEIAQGAAGSLAAAGSSSHATSPLAGS